MPAYSLVVREAFERGVHGLLDRPRPHHAPSSLKEIVVDVHESLRHELSISDAEPGYTSGLLRSSSSADTATGRWKGLQETWLPRKTAYGERIREETIVKVLRFQPEY